VRPGETCRSVMPTHHLLQSLRAMQKVDAWDRLMDAISAACDGTIRMIGSTSIRAH
jgi:Transposase DDE domain